MKLIYVKPGLFSWAWRSGTDPGGRL